MKPFIMAALTSLIPTDYPVYSDPCSSKILSHNCLSGCSCVWCGLSYNRSEGVCLTNSLDSRDTCSRFRWNDLVIDPRCEIPKPTPTPSPPLCIPVSFDTVFLILYLLIAISVMCLIYLFIRCRKCLCDREQDQLMAG